MHRKKSNASKKSSRDTKAILHFQDKIIRWYQEHHRNSLPWRKKITPYRILVSEMMLQQTQVARVIPKFRDFLKKYPTVTSLANGSFADILRLWSGLGYNRRAKFLFNAATAIQNRPKPHTGTFPKDKMELRTLPGVGSYTASAIAAFAYNQPTVLIETNIRTVFIHEFFSHSEEKITDATLLSLIERSLPSERKISAREWYWALMDYGSHLKSAGSKVHRVSSTYQKQSAFKGSRREIRGAILKQLKSKPRVSIGLLEIHFADRKAAVSSVIEDLVNEGLLRRTPYFVYLP